MPLLTGRNNEPLNEREILRGANTFLGLDNNAPVRHEAGAATKFIVTQEAGEDVPEIVFGPDLYPGRNVVDPNSSLSLEAAAAHELMHLYRWRNKRDLPNDVLAEIDEALTSLEAILRFPKQLGESDIRQLVSDAIQRLNRFVQGQGV